MEWSDRSPGYSLRALLSHLTKSQLADLVGLEVISALEAGIQEKATDSALREALEAYLDPRDLIGDPALRARVLGLLPLGKAQELVERITGSSASDPYKALQAFTGTLTRSETVSLLAFFGVKWTNEDERRKTGIPSRATADVTPRYGLFDYQRMTLRKVKAGLDETRSVLLHMPTGSGKTRTAMHLIADHIRRHEKTLVFWLSEQPEVLEQAVDAFLEAWSAMGNRPTRIHRLFGDNDIDLTQLNDGLAVGGFQKLHALHSKDENALLTLGDRTGLVVVDEAHQAIAPTYNSVIRAVARKRPGTRLLGLTATPGRSWLDVEEDLRLSEFFESRKVTLTAPDARNPIEFLMAEGYLARPTFRHVELSRGPPQEGSDGGFEPLIDKARLISEAITMAFEHKKLIVFAPSVADARLVSASLNMRGIHAEVITAETPDPVRQLAYHRFRTPGGRPMALVNYGVLTTGFDAPVAKGAIIARPTRSLVLFSQMVGRVLRGPRANGTETAEVVTTIDTALPGFGSVSEAFHNWEDVWNE